MRKTRAIWMMVWTIYLIIVSPFIIPTMLMSWLSKLNEAVLGKIYDFKCYLIRKYKPEG